MRGLGLIVSVMMLAGAFPAFAQTGTTLPIAKGMWIQSTDRCATATSGYAYDGGRWGQIYYYGPNGSMGPVGEFQAIVSANAVADGFTNMKLSDSGELGYFHVKSTGSDRMTLRVGAPGRERIDIMDEALTRCDFSSLSAKMQAAIRRFAPTLAVPGAAPGSAASAPTAARSASASSTSTSASPWKIETISTGKLAIYGGAGVVKSLTLSCGPRGDSGEIYLETNARSRAPQMTAVFRDDMGSQPQLAFAYNARHNIWTAAASSVVIQMLSEGNSITVDLGAMGRDRISLAGSTRTIREAMASCLYAAGTPPPPVAPLGIAPGHYVREGELCGDAIGVFYYDGRRYGMIYDSASEPGIVSAIGRPRRVGRAWALGDGSMVEPLAAGRIRWTLEEGSDYRWCPATAIEAAKRVR